MTNLYSPGISREARRHRRGRRFVLNKPEVFLSAFDGTFDKESSELVSSDKQELLVQQLEALKELSLKLNPQGSNPEL